MLDFLRRWFPIAPSEDLKCATDALRREIEARKEAEVRLRNLLSSERLASEAQIRAYFEAASQGIIVVDRVGRIALVNRLAEQMFGYERTELIGQPLGILLPERYHHIHEREVNDYFVRPRMRRMGGGMELAARRKDGTEFPAEIGLSHVPTPDGAQALALISDVTERRRTADRLAHAMEELRRSNAELEQFANLASHDLQEPLRTVTGYLDILERRYSQQLDTEAIEFIRYAVHGAGRMRAMIREILNLSRVGTQPVKPLYVPAEVIVQSALRNLQAAVDESGAEIVIDPLPAVLADPDLLTLVFQNLIGNAIKFRGPGVPRICILGEQRLGEWVFAVKDNGIGIEAQHFEKIFAMFARLHAAERYPGTGVGLALAHRIVERHGGRIWVESEPERGSVFYFSVPQQRESHEV